MQQRKNAHITGCRRRPPSGSISEPVQDPEDGRTKSRGAPAGQAATDRRTSARLANCVPKITIRNGSTSRPKRLKPAMKNRARSTAENVPARRQK